MPYDMIFIWIQKWDHFVVFVLTCSLWALYCCKFLSPLPPEHAPSPPTTSEHAPSPPTTSKHAPSPPTTSEHAPSSLTTSEHAPSSPTTSEHDLVPSKHMRSSYTFRSEPSPEWKCIQDWFGSHALPSERHATVEESIEQILARCPLIFTREALTAFAYWNTPLQWMCYVMNLDHCDSLAQSIKWKRRVEQKIAHFSKVLRLNPSRLEESLILRHFSSVGGLYPKWTSAQRDVLSNRVRLDHFDALFETRMKSSTPLLHGLIGNLQNTWCFPLTTFHRWTFLLLKSDSKMWTQLSRFCDKWASPDCQTWHHHVDVQLHRLLYAHLRYSRPVHTLVDLQIMLMRKLGDSEALYLWDPIPMPEGLNSLYEACVQRLEWNGQSDKIYQSYTSSVRADIQDAIAQARDAFGIKHQDLAFLVLMLSLPEGGVLRAYSQGHLALYVLQACVRRRKPKVLSNRGLYQYTASAIADRICKRHPALIQCD